MLSACSECLPIKRHLGSPLLACLGVLRGLLPLGSQDPGHCQESDVNCQEHGLLYTLSLWLFHVGMNVTGRWSMGRIRKDCKER